MADTERDGSGGNPDTAIQSTDFAATLDAALDTFTQALIRRWRVDVAIAIIGGDWEAIPEHARGSVWPFTSRAAREHVVDFDGSPRLCAYLRWVQEGQVEPLDSVICGGEAHRVTDDGQVHEYWIECGVGSILEQVADWAYQERQAVAQELPLFDHHDLIALRSAHGTLLDIGSRLGLTADTGSDPGLLADDPATRPIPEVVIRLADEDNQHTDWWAGWTGLAADRARDGFFASVRPTMSNQAGLAGWLANLYNSRAAIIVKGRNDALYWLQWATKSLADKETVTYDQAAGWKTITGIGMFVAAAGGWHPAGAIAGAVVQLVGFLGEQLWSKVTAKAYANDRLEVLSQLRDEIRKLNDDLATHESDYATLQTQIQAALDGADSYNVELYDLTRNDPDGTRQPGQTGFHVDVEFVLGIAQNCYELAERYADLLPLIRGTEAADAELADKDGKQTPADLGVLELRDLLGEFLKTTAARYQLAGQQTQAAAEAYVAEDESQRDTLNRILADWRTHGVGDKDLGFDPEEYAQETDRPGLPGVTDTQRDYGVTNPSEERRELEERQDAHRERGGD
ncbi:MAG TPA: hypothetical protein VIL37_02435 [Natronosporangium sp.]